MADDSEKTGETPAPKGAAAAGESSNELPKIDSPPLSPAEDKPAADEPIAEPITLPVLRLDATRARARFRLTARHKRGAILGASVMLAAALGATAGLMAGNGIDTPAPQRTNVAERQAMENAIGKLSAEIATLKAQLAAPERDAQSAVPKIAARIPPAPVTAPEPELTGSIPTTPAIATPPLPVPRPVLADRTPVVRDWSIRYVRDGYVYVHGRGDTYQVVRGAPLPGLGPVSAIKRQDGRWLVVTPKGLIVAARDRRYFERQ